MNQIMKLLCQKLFKMVIPYFYFQINKDLIIFILELLIFINKFLCLNRSKINKLYHNLYKQIEKSTPQRTLNASLNLINEPVMTSRQVALKSKMKDCSHNSHSNEAAQIPNKAEEAQDIPTKSNLMNKYILIDHESIYQQFNNAIKPGFDLELALK